MMFLNLFLPLIICILLLDGLAYRLINFVDNFEEPLFNSMIFLCIPIFNFTDFYFNLYYYFLYFLGACFALLSFLK